MNEEMKCGFKVKKMKIQDVVKVTGIQNPQNLMHRKSEWKRELRYMS